MPPTYGGMPQQSYGAMPPQSYGSVPPQSYGSVPPQTYGSVPPTYGSYGSSYGGYRGGGFSPWGTALSVALLLLRNCEPFFGSLPFGQHVSGPQQPYGAGYDYDYDNHRRQPSYDGRASFCHAPPAFTAVLPLDNSTLSRGPRI
eukprot:17107-Amphidinium_carterae.1